MILVVCDRSSGSFADVLLEIRWTDEVGRVLELLGLPCFGVPGPSLPEVFVLIEVVLSA